MIGSISASALVLAISVVFHPRLARRSFGVCTPTALRELVQHLNSTGLRHSRIKVDHYGNKEFVWLDDPNGFRLEFYCRPTSPTS
jgi:hypothetical protein